MRILIVSPHFPPMPSSGALRPYAWACAWAGAGHELTVLTTRKREDQRSRPMPVDGVRVIETPVDAPSVFHRVRSTAGSGGSARSESSSGLKSMLVRVRDRSGVFGSMRMPDLTGWWVRPAIAAARDEAAARRGRGGGGGGGGGGGWDVVVSSAGPYTAHLVARCLRSSGLARRWVADYRDLWTGNPIYPGLPIIRWREKMLERRVLAEADLVTTVSRSLASWFDQNAGVRAEVIYNGYLSDAPGNIPARRFEPAGGLHLVHTGTIYPLSQDPMPLCRAMRLLLDRRPRSKPCTLHLAGIRLGPWLDAARAAGVEGRVCAHGFVSHCESLSMQRGADALVVLGFAGAAGGSLPGKVFEYLRAEAPIVLIGGSDESEISRLLAATGRGITLGSDPEHIAQRLAHIPELTPDYEAIAGYDRKVQAGRLLDILSDLASGSA